MFGELPAPLQRGWLSFLSPVVDHVDHKGHHGDDLEDDRDVLDFHRFFLLCGEGQSLPLST